ncbi:MAG: bifunctional phosphopantothenoylcysteine decarboxylase/phosphopantothenate--cysteine ligase CoaBC [Burkholderiaceae bacterium]
MAQSIGDLEGKSLILGLSGGIAAYKSAFLARRLQEHGAKVQVVMTEAATQFITAVTMQGLTGNPVYTSQWDGRPQNGMAHIDLSRGKDAILVVPASADFMAKLANGAADDLLSTLCLARDCPLLVAPAMNRQMWAHPATQRNANQLRADGVALLGPTSGDQACGEVGAGRMLEPEEVLDDVIAFFQPKLLRDMRVLITAGPTFEPLDPVRGLTNRSSGKMGYSLARAAREAGARVTLVSGPTALPAPRGVNRIPVETAEQMLSAVLSYVDHAQIFIGVAAVADWRSAYVSDSKIKKGEPGSGPPQFDLVENPDILATVAALPGAPYCVGFAAETGELDRHAQVKRQKKNIPLLVGNLAQKTFGSDDSELVLYDETSTTRLDRADKLTLARRLVVEIARRLPT